MEKKILARYHTQKELYITSAIDLSLVPMIIKIKLAQTVTWWHFHGSTSVSKSLICI